MINIGIGVGWAKALYSVANNVIANFKARVLSYPNSIFEAGPCLDATLEELNAIGLLDNASLVITPNAYNEGILYDVIPNTTLGDMDVVRATTATRVNRAGLIEVVPRNLVTYSEQFSDASWLKSGVTITANTTIAPNGTTTASKIVENGTLVTYGIYKSIPTGFRYSHSIYAKKGERDWIKFNCIHGGNASVWFNLANGTIGANYSTGIPSIENVGNGWYRCAVNNTDHSSAASFFSVMPCTNNNVETYTGTVGNGIFIWGAQLDQGSTATEYFPTTTRLNIPRIDYTNGSCPSILVEPQRTNLLTYNNTFSDISWFKPNTVITLGTIISPDGLINSSILTDTVTNSSHVVQKTLTVSLGQSYSISIYAKKKDLNFLIIGTTGMGTGYSYFNINNGTIGNVLSTHTAKIINANNGWYKCVITGVTTSTTLNVLYGITNTNGTSDYVGTGLGNYIYGTQVELGSYDTSLIPTIASTVTRNADIISKTGISSLIGQTEGTMFLDFELLPNNTNGSYLFALNDGTLANMIRSEIYILSPTVSQFRTGVNTLGVSQGDNFTTISQLKNKMAISYSLNNLKIFINGVLVATDTSVTIPVMNTFYLGNRLLENIIGSSYKQAILFKTQLTNAECILLTGDTYNSYAEMATNLNYILQ